MGRKRPQTQPSPTPSPQVVTVVKTVLVKDVSAQQVIKAADEALKKKDLAIAQTEAARLDAQTALAASQKQVISKDKQLGSVGRNSYIMLGSGVAGGALIAANVIAPGIGIIVVAAIFAIFKL